MTEKVDKGVIPLVIESLARRTNCKNCGEKLDCINGGTITGAIISHLLLAVGKNKLAIAIYKMEIIRRGTPPNEMLSITLATIPVIMVPIFVLRKT